MKNGFSRFILLTTVSVVDVLCMMMVFLVPEWRAEFSVLRYWGVNLGIVSLGFSMATLIIMAAGFVHAEEEPAMTGVEKVSLAVIAGYVLFVLVYLWALLRQGI